MNDTVREFFKFLDVDPDAIASLEKSKIKNANSVNPILFNWAIYKPGYPFKPISIEDIVGHDRRTQGSLVYDLQNYFDRDGDGYYKRSVSLLNINSEELMNKLANSFMGDPVHVNEYDENVYGIGSNGLHRFHVIKMHYLTELLRDPQAERELRKKYTFPVKVTSLDFTKTYSSYLINSLYPGRFKINGAYENAAIGGWLSNAILWNDAIVAWWNGNKWNIGWVVLWWEDNEANGVVLWWQGNKVGTNGLAMWKLAKWWDWSFVRNDGSYLGQAKNSSALIWTQRWVIISKGSITPKAWVLLDVDWAVQIWNNTTDLTAGVWWEIRSLNGCLYAHDGESWHILGKSSVSDCNREWVATTCEFGRVLLQEWDKVMAYSERYSRDICQSVEVTCRSGQLVAEWWATNYIYPSCFELNDDPYYISGN